MEERHKLHEAARKWTVFFANIVDQFSSYEWTGEVNNHLFEVIRRSVAIRQLEAIRAIESMCETGHGHFGVTMLRPAYEELIWMEYLAKHPNHAKEVVLLLARDELSSNLDAQNIYIGSAGMVAHGFSPRYVKTNLARLRPVRARLQEVGKELGWREGTLVPSIAFLARKVSREREYKFLYQGTSRYVHFSTQELLRRAWGSTGKVKISSATFSTYWQDFAIYWAFHIMLNLLTGYDDIIMQTRVDDETWSDLRTALETMAPIPIITAAELAGWN